MDQFSISNLADWFEAHNDEIMAETTLSWIPRRFCHCGII